MVSIVGRCPKLHLEYQYNFRLKLLEESSPSEKAEQDHLGQLVAKCQDEVVVAVVKEDLELCCTTV
jgi:hypothetical protein